MLAISLPAASRQMSRSRRRTTTWTTGSMRSTGDKYGRSSSAVDHINSPEARSTTIRLERIAGG